MLACRAVTRLASFIVLSTLAIACVPTDDLLAACPNRSYLEAHGFGLDRYIADPMALVDGCAVAPDRPGHGIRFDWKGLERVRA